LQGIKGKCGHEEKKSQPRSRSRFFDIARTQEIGVYCVQIALTLGPEVGKACAIKQNDTVKYAHTIWKNTSILEERVTPSPRARVMFSFPAFAAAPISREESSES